MCMFIHAGTKLFMLVAHVRAVPTQRTHAKMVIVHIIATPQYRSMFSRRQHRPGDLGSSRWAWPSLIVKQIMHQVGWFKFSYVHNGSNGTIYSIYVYSIYIYIIICIITAHIYCIKWWERIQVVFRAGGNPWIPWPKFRSSKIWGCQ